MVNEYKTVLIMDGKGRITIPSKVRDMMNVKEGEVFALILQDGIIQVFPVDLNEIEKNK
jgi:AbrB family looped-hinge helix DNA binding protein